MKTTYKLIFCCALLLSLAVISCKKGGSLGPPDVYVAGQYYNEEIHASQAAYWKNDEFHPVSVESYLSSAVGIAVNKAGDVFLAGTADGPCYWKNGVRFNLGKPDCEGWATDILIKDEVLYITGYAQSVPNGVKIAVLWTIDNQGNRKDYFLENVESGTGKMTLVGDDIYIAGSISHKPCYWKWSLNSKTRTDLGPNSGGVRLVIGHHEKFYALGNYDMANNNVDYTGYWLNTEFIPLGMAYPVTEVYGMAFDPNGSLHIVGRSKPNGNDSPHAVVWKDSRDNTQSLSDQSSNARGIQFYDGDEYVCGQQGDIACYWKNGVLNTLKTNQSAGYSILVMRRK